MVEEKKKFPIFLIGSIFGVFIQGIYYFLVSISVLEIILFNWSLLLAVIFIILTIISLVKEKISKKIKALQILLLILHLLPILFLIYMIWSIATKGF